MLTERMMHAPRPCAPGFRRIRHAARYLCAFLSAIGTDPDAILRRPGRTIIRGKIRRAMIGCVPGLASNLRRKHGLTGGCTSCGASCNLLFTCPHWDKESRFVRYTRIVRWRAACFRSRLPICGTGVSLRTAPSVATALSGRFHRSIDRGNPKTSDRRAACCCAAALMYDGEKFNPVSRFIGAVLAHVHAPVARRVDKTPQEIPPQKGSNPFAANPG